MTIPAHLVRASDHLNRDSAHLVYARVGTGQLNWAYRKYAVAYVEDPSNWASVVASMKAQVWYETGVGLAAGGRLSGQFYAIAGVAVCDMSNLRDMYTFDSHDMQGKTAKIVEVVISVTSSETWRCGVVSTDTLPPPDDWTWLEAQTSITGTTSGRFEIARNLVLNRWLLFLFSFVDYPEPSDGTVYNAGLPLEDDPVQFYLHF